jgi:hypothetical protein
MTKAECLKQLYILSVTAGMNQRYHQHKWTHFGRNDKAIRVSVGIVAALSLVASVLGAANNWPEVNITSAVISGVGLIFAIWLNVSPAGEKELRHQGLFQQWSDLRIDVDTTRVRVEALEDEGQVPNEFIVRLQDLTQKNRINAQENAPDEKLLQNCYEKENKSRTGYATRQEQETAKRKRQAEATSGSDSEM